MQLPLAAINAHLDSNCETSGEGLQESLATGKTNATQTSAEPAGSNTQSFFTPTQSRRLTGRQEVLETPVYSQPSQESRKRKVEQEAEEEGNHSTPRADKVQAVSKTEHTPRGKEALVQAAPLAERVRPRNLDEFIGQADLVASNGLLRGLIDAGRIPSLILWGPSGTGKTTLARIIARTAGVEYAFKELSATNNNVADCKKVFEEASNLLSLTGKKTLVFLDEIHRFTKSQQDVFLPYVESGRITLLGATTENPSFRINNALISRCRVFTLAALTTEDVVAILDQALTRIEDSLPGEYIDYLARTCDGDARAALNLLDMVLTLPRASLTLDAVRASLRRTTVTYDRAGDGHYDTISALHKSIRGSAVDASLYYLGRMLEAGEDPLYIARRMVRIASEDVGLADCAALPLCSAIYTAVQQVGMPEADCVLAQGVVYLAQAPKSTAVYRAYGQVKSLLREQDGAATASIPMHIRNAPTGLLRELGYGQGQGHANEPDGEGSVEQAFLPEPLRGTTFYEPDEPEPSHQLWSEMDEGERLL
ncbi:putative AAA family ATPase [Taphrina deformans PYCC 5710]|uniref:AAA family ATPase n=1 Tax=Taphrina deformans (strain PYCC 5710 / ATCC 11124 / CBS 356.35 / IMI 108563 / JCM 9778 / NBRC 8474) TaxID=1097556 RepID=R4XAN5_TAPDE|nr:putative AAA family ATPase [Taphrina deformans PYCC 5710]|eukprot:CCG81373.1 putative AAA family ATPase [Taphrina deformans PYCC 5710]